jgi:hypothetical protein
LKIEFLKNPINPLIKQIKVQIMVTNQPTFLIAVYHPARLRLAPLQRRGIFDKKPVNVFDGISEINSGMMWCEL